MTRTLKIAGTALTALWLSSTALAGAAHANTEITELKKQMMVLMQRVEELERRDAENETKIATARKEARAEARKEARAAARKEIKVAATQEAKAAVRSANKVSARRTVEAEERREAEVAARVEAQVVATLTAREEAQAAARAADGRVRNGDKVSSAFVKPRDRTSPDELDPLTGRGFLVGDTEVEIGGFTKVDFIYDLDEAAGDDLFVPQAISVIAENDQERFGAHAKESRFFIKTSTPTNFGDLKTHIEGDFFATTISSNEIVTNSFPFRLRHAYGEWNGLLAGQFWSAFVPIEAYPSTVDFGGPLGNSFLRQAQIRYTYDASEKLRLIVSAENSETTFRTNGLEAASVPGETLVTGAESTSFGFRAGLDSIPDFIASATYRGDRGLVKAAALFRELNAPFSDDSAFGYGLQLSARYSLTEKTELIGSALYGQGVGRYVFAGINQGGFVSSFTGTGTAIAGGTIDPIETVSGYLKVQHKLNDQITLAAIYGHYELTEQFTQFDTDRMQSVHASLYYQPIEGVTFGSEVIYGRRALVNGLEDEIVRLQTSVKYEF